MKITIDIDENDLTDWSYLTWPPTPVQRRRNGNSYDYEQTETVIRPGTYYWNKQHNNGWVDGIDRCANCPNNPLNPNSTNYGGTCMCAIPSMYGPNRITC